MDLSAAQAADRAVVQPAGRPGRRAVQRPCGQPGEFQRRMSKTGCCSCSRNAEVDYVLPLSAKTDGFRERGSMPSGALQQGDGAECATERRSNLGDRRLFLARLAALGGAAVRTGPEPCAAAEPPQNAGGRRSTATPPAGGRGKVQQVRGEIKEYKDPKTGARVRRLTGDGSSNVHPYFTSWAFVGDDADHTIFVSNRSGAYQWHLLDIPAARLVQLTAGQKISPNMACVARSGRLFYFDGPVLHAVKTDTLEDRELYRVPAGFKPALPTCTADGRYVAFAYCQETALSTETGRIYATMHERYYQHPHSVVMRIDTESGDAVAAWGEPTWISHVLIHPTQPNLILFCHEGGGTCVKQRMWMVNLDDKQMRQATPLYPQRPGESCVHEYFTQQGDVGFQYSLDRDETPRGVQRLHPARRNVDSPVSLPRPASRATSSRTRTTAWSSATGPILSPDDKEGGKYIGPDDPRQRPRPSPPPGLARHLRAHPGQPRPSQLQPGRPLGDLQLRRREVRQRVHGGRAEPLSESPRQLAADSRGTAAGDLLSSVSAAFPESCKWTRRRD